MHIHNQFSETGGECTSGTVDAQTQVQERNIGDNAPCMQESLIDVHTWPCIAACTGYIGRRRV